MRITRWRDVLRWGLRGLGALTAFGLLLLVVTPLGRYLLRAGYEEARILLARRRIEAMVADSAVDGATRAKLQLVLEARAFAVDSLGLPAGETFTRFTQLRSDTLVLLLSGARADWLEPVLWRFPLVGRLPYKGFFRPADALAAEAALRARGFDTYLRPASAFSTLGWFNDPLLSTTLAQDSVNLVNTVIHELTHNRYFASGEATFNESFANFVGARGAEAFFRARGDTLNARRAVARWADDRLLAAFWGQLYRGLDSAFRAHPGDALRARRIALRDSTYAAARRTLVDSLAPLWMTIAPRYAERVPLDNAALLARRVYLSDLEAFETDWQAQGRDLRRTIDALIAAHRARFD
ncbi:MAG: aminopeptidase [Gemmatimonadaceae bacterium]|nr:aminopeptidase [Gemmatimonadaceae bacterium]MCW5825907.1 aminopeptidase [Gemmatimonadaceae bacterium]